MRDSDRDDLDDRKLDGLVSAARTGASDATAALLKEFEPLLRGYLERNAGGQLRRYTGGDDLVQEVHASMIASLDRLRPEATAEDFRRLMLLHAKWALGTAARRAGRFDGESVGGDQAERAATTPSVGSVTGRDRDLWLSERIGELADDGAAVLRSFLSGMSFREIGTALGISEGTARKRYLRALAQIGGTTPNDERS